MLEPAHPGHHALDAEAETGVRDGAVKPEIRVQHVPEGRESTWYFFVVMLPCEADPVRRRLLLRGIDAGIREEIADNCASMLGYHDCPHVDYVSSHAMALPMYDGISDKAIRKIAQRLNKLL